MALKRFDFSLSESYDQYVEEKTRYTESKSSSGFEQGLDTITAKEMSIMHQNE